MDLVRSRKDVEKLQRIQAQEKFIVNVSKTIRSRLVKLSLLTHARNQHETLTH